MGTTHLSSIAIDHHMRQHSSSSIQGNLLDLGGRAVLPMPRLAAYRAQRPTESIAAGYIA